LGFVVACSGVGIIPLAVVLIVLGNRTKPSCPHCDRNDALRPWAGRPTPDADRMWEVARRQDEKSFKVNKLILFGVVMTMLLLAIVFAVVVVTRQGPL